jgi:hemerythrin-like domain-containing protein
MADALAVLAADHKELQQLLAEFDELASDGAGATERQALAAQICQALTAHAVAEEDVFYPALRQALQPQEGDVVDDLLDDALVEHDGQRALVEQIETMDAHHERFDALVILLARAVARHVTREEEDLFPRAREAGLDLQRLGEQIARRRDVALLLLSEADDPLQAR